MPRKAKEDESHLLAQVRAGRERAQKLSQQLLEVQERERRHLARELHDEIGQALTAVKMNLQALERDIKTATMRGRLEESLAIVDRALHQVRDLSLDLRPSVLDDLGLVSALRWHLDRQAQRGSFTAEFVAHPSDIHASTDLETACFRVAQEGLTNIVRHSQAKHVRLELSQQQHELHLVLRDDGVGFDVAAAQVRATEGRSFGLLGMQERIVLMRGRIEIDSARGRGTSIRVWLPLDAMPTVERRRQPR